MRRKTTMELISVSFLSIISTNTVYHSLLFVGATDIRELLALNFVQSFEHEHVSEMKLLNCPSL